MRNHGFSLVWALILGALLMGLAFALVQNAMAVNRSSGGLTRGALLDVQERNLFHYSQRLTEANLANLLRSLPPPSPDSAALTVSLQARLDQFCARDPDSQGAGRIRIYATSRACGVALPSTLPPVTQQVQNGLTTVSIPLTYVTEIGARPSIKTAALSAQYGSPAAGIYALLVPGNFYFPPNLHVRGNVQINGQLSFDAPPDVNGSLGFSNCAVPYDNCNGPLQVNRAGTETGVMSLTPTSRHPDGMTGALVAGTGAEVPSLPVGVTAFGVNADQLSLGVMGDGSQYIKACWSGTCNEYQAPADGNLYTLDTHTLISSPWNGVLSVTSPSSLSVGPVQSDAPSIARPLSILSNAPVMVTGNLTYDQTSCSKQLCNAAGTTEILGINTPSLTVAAGVQRLHAQITSQTFSGGNGLTIFGNLSSQPTISGELFIQVDERVLGGTVPPITGTLGTRWRFGELNLKQ